MIITGVQAEANYRAVRMDSSSSLKEFSLDRKKYYKKYFLNETVEEEDNKASIMGRVVETLLLEPEEFDGRFALSVCTSAPTGLMLAFVEALYKFTAEATDSDGNITREFEDICKDAYVESGFKIKFEAVMGKFIGSDNEIYYKEIREIRSKGLTVVTTNDVTNAEKIVIDLKSNDVTYKVINLVNSDKFFVINQLKVEGYDVDGHLFKSMMDKVVVDHKEKTVSVYDLKCTWSVENFYEEYYLYRRAYIQAYLYWKAAQSWANKMGYEDYKINYPQFIVCDSTGYMNPLIYTIDSILMQDAYLGFEHKGRKYPGVGELIKALDWAVENDRWNISRENYVNNGLIKLGA